MVQTVCIPQLNGYNGRGPSQCWPEVLDVIRSLCPKMENLHLCTSYDDTVIALAKFRNIKTLSIFRSVAKLRTLFTPSLIHTPIFDSGFLNVGKDMDKFGKLTRNS